MSGVAPIRVARVGTSITLKLVLANQMRALTEDGFEIVCVCDEDDWADALRDDGFDVWPLGMGRRPSAARGLRWAVSVYRQLRAGSVEIVHTHNAFHGIAGRLAARAAGIPVVVQTVHNWWYLDEGGTLRRWAYRSLERLGAAVSDAVFFLNRDDAERAVRERIVPKEKCRFIGNGIDVRAFAARLGALDRDAERARLGLADTTEAIVMVARLEPPKDHATLLDAFTLIRRERPEARLLLAGYGRSEGKIRDDARARDLATSVDFLGYVDDVPRLLRAADLLVLSSACEGFGRCLVEGMLAGLPVVATDTVGVRDVISHDQTGFLVPMRDPEALARQISDLLSNPELAARTAAAGRAAAFSRFDEREAAHEVARIYRQLLADTRTGSANPRPARRRQTRVEERATG